MDVDEGCKPRIGVEVSVAAVVAAVVDAVDFAAVVAANDVVAHKSSSCCPFLSPR